GRIGAVWVAKRADGAILLERRPDRGLLGGMLGFPGTDWDARGGQPSGKPPLAANWRQALGNLRHTFTHFHLQLTVFVALAPMDALPERGHFLPQDSFAPTDLPTLMRKAHDLGVSALLSD
ncbi:MAG: NUDIX domain-containing protein, partial [Paracoccaceae bacterium]|nr:NUDIX domain-containing protein [Paracoccaceae bacterium]